MVAEKNLSFQIFDNKKWIFLFAFMGCLGMTVEIFFTAVTGVITGEMGMQLKGFSYIWMFPIYGIAGIAFPPLMQRILHLNILLRACIYAAGILTIEFITGWLIDITTGSCPWQYTSGWQICGYIRLDYFPLWSLFGILVERVLLFLLRKIQ